MVNQKRRQALKTICAVATTVAVAPTVIASQPQYVLKACSVLDGTSDGGLHIDIRACPTGEKAELTIENRTGVPACLRHVSPGVTRADHNLFDINDAFGDGPLKLAAGERRRFALAPLAPGAGESPIPGGVIENDLVVVTGHARHSGTGREFRSRRLRLS